jgi:uncharacterized protein YdcH (DUF465 family)
MQKELDMIMENFPEHREKIAELFRNNEDFKSLCMDYWQCRIAMIKFRETVLDDVRTENEYVKLLNELEQEAARFLCRFK